MNFLYLLSSAKSDSFLLLDFMHLLSLDESDLPDDEYANDRSESRSSGTCAFTFRFDNTIGRVSGVDYGVFFQYESNPIVTLLHWSCLYQ